MWRVHWNAWLADELNPRIRWSSLFAARVASVDRSRGLHEHGAAFTSCRGHVFDPLRNDKHLPILDRYIAISQVNGHFPIQHDEHLIGVFVAMPNELPLKLDEFEMILVHLGDNLRRPVLRELRELFAEVDCGLHMPPFAMLANAVIGRECKKSVVFISSANLLSSKSPYLWQEGTVGSSH